jgi:hypothetical protein
MKNFIYIEDNFFDKKICQNIIEKYKNNTLKGETHTGYDYFFLKNDDMLLEEINKKLINSIKNYLNLYPEANLTKNTYTLQEIRFKHFKPGNFFSKWHSEVGYNSPNRVLNMMIYLSQHNCGTEFFDSSTIKSEIGRLTIFPSYFTHTHRGQVCPENKDRYIIGGYFNFVNN